MEATKTQLETAAVDAAEEEQTKPAAEPRKPAAKKIKPAAAVDATPCHVVKMPGREIKIKRIAPGVDMAEGAKLLAATNESGSLVAAPELEKLSVKEINAIASAIKGEPVGGEKDSKKTAIARALKLAIGLPVEAAKEGAKAKARRPAKAREPRVLTITFDPRDEKQVAELANLAPQGRACVLAALGVSRPPSEKKVVKIDASELEATLEKRRDLFASAAGQPLKRVWGYHRPMLVAGGFLATDGKASARATDGYSYAFKLDPTEKNVAKLEDLPPQAIAIVKIVLGLGAKVETGGAVRERTLLGKELRAKVEQARATGKLETKQNPFRIFQYHEHLLVAAGFLRVTAEE